MNKLASIYFLQSLGLPTIDPCIIKSRTEKGIRKEIDSFYHEHESGLCLRCGEWPNEKAKMEGPLPWCEVSDKEGLIEKTLEFQKEIGENYFVFFHKQADMVKGGVMLIEGNRVVIEAGAGGSKELNKMYRGGRSPEQILIFNPGMLSFKESGKKILSGKDLYDMRNIERSLNYKDIGAIGALVSIEFSKLKDDSLYVHDLRVVS